MFVATGDRFKTGSTDFENELARTEIYRKVLFSFEQGKYQPILEGVNFKYILASIRPFLLLGNFRLSLKSKFLSAMNLVRLK